MRLIGGYDPLGPTEPDRTLPATPTTESIDAAAASPSWTPSPSLNVGRSHLNAVLLPDGSMVGVGGGRGFGPGIGAYAVYDDGRARQVELYDPADGSWRLGPAEVEDRAYHSTAVLLPDGRVMSAGDDSHPYQANGARSLTDTAEIYSPPYLFRGERPSIADAPETIAWGDTFGVRSPSPGVSRAVLMAPSATTHGNDMNQRHVELEVAGREPGQGLDVVAPPQPGVAPPGYYMLFLLDDEGVPSVARWIRLTGDAPDQPRLGDDVLAPRVKVTTTLRLARLRSKGKIVADAGVNESARVRLSFASREGDTGWVTLDPAGAGFQRVLARLPKAARPALRAGSRLKLRVRARDDSGNKSGWSRALRVEP
ncbi:MAG: DUF1929 domain-containing protein [Solirubrobacterales bacterium]|nr:DUF1929 domain-containing protein [Solirubrobacterales bacterium]